MYIVYSLIQLEDPDMLSPTAPPPSLCKSILANHCDARQVTIRALAVASRYNELRGNFLAISPLLACEYCGGGS